MTRFVISAWGLFTLLRVAVVFGMEAAGGWFAEGRLLVGLPLLAPAALVSLVWTGEMYQVAFLADNPGVWMDHCHNLDHAATGMTMHLAYDGVTTPFEVGHDTPNQPE